MVRLTFTLVALAATTSVGSAIAAEDSSFLLEYNVANHLDEARDVFGRFLVSSTDSYSLADFKQTMDQNNVGEEVVRLAFERDDADGDGKVVFEEFVQWYTRGDLFLQLDGCLPGEERDGRVSREEFLVAWHGMPISIFERDDADSDGYVTFSEFSGPKGAHGHQVNVFAALDADNDGIITLAEFEADWHAVDKSVFHAEDVDQDGQLTWEEFKGPKGASLEEALATTPEYPDVDNQEAAGELNLFAALDIDIDGRISEAEFFVEWHTEATPAMFESEDADHDGHISWAEFSGPKGAVDPVPQLQQNLFIVLDTDADFVLSREEFMVTKQALPEAERDAAFEKEDANGDGGVSWDEFSGAKGDAPPTYDVFGRLDADQDGHITKEEFLIDNNSRGTEEQFQKEDKDGDGRITYEEFDGPKLPRSEPAPEEPGQREL